MEIHLARVFICLLSLLIAIQAFAAKSDEDLTNGKSDSACSAMGTRCLCRRPRRKEQSLTCLKQNCMERLPTDEIPDAQVKEVVSLLVVRQHNLTRIGSDELRRLGNIRHIRIFRCRVREVAPNAFIGLNFVERLDLHRNDLSDVPSAIRYLTHLRSLNLGGNRIQFIRNGAFYANKHLERLIIGRNALTQMPTLLPRSLIKLSVNKNNLESFGGITKLTNLRILNAAGNKLKSFPALPESTRILNLCSNTINHTISLAALPNLTEINLNHNPSLGSISLSTFLDAESRSSASKLETFKARNSGVTDVGADAFSCLPRLRNVDVAQNLIRDYHENWFSGNRMLRSIALSGNNFECVCDVAASLRKVAEVLSRRRGKNQLSRDSGSPVTHDFDSVNCSAKVRRPCGDFKLHRGFCAAEDSGIATRKTTASENMAEPTTSFKPTPTRQTTMTFPTTATSASSNGKNGTTSTAGVSKKKTTAATSTASTSTLGTTEFVKDATESPSERLEDIAGKAKGVATKSYSTEKQRIPSTTLSTKTTTSTMTKPTNTEASSTSSKRIVLPPIVAVPDDTTVLTRHFSIPPETSTEKNEDLVLKEWCLEDGRKCHFPFTYGGEEHNKCLSTFSRTWCSATENYDVDGDWDYCEIC